MRRVSRSAITKAPGSDVCGTPILGTLRPSVTDLPQRIAASPELHRFPGQRSSGERCTPVLLPARLVGCSCRAATVRPPLGVFQAGAKGHEGGAMLLPVGCQKAVLHAAGSYSWISPPSRS